MTQLERIKKAAAEGAILASTADNVAQFLEAGLPDWARESIDELVTGQAWSELNDRFYRFLEFGTGGMRGRTIGRKVTRAEQGENAADEAPAHAGIGSNLLNDFTLIRAVIGPQPQPSPQSS